jgi:uncharacterized SAM-binding protein YcdF (DUF218 family)
MPGKFILFCIGSILFNSCVFLGPSSKELLRRATSKKPYDVIIVPGMPYDSALGNWTMAMKGRIYWSKYLYDKGIAKNIIYSGSAVYTPYVEAKIMTMYGEAIGIPANVMFAETKAEHSTENLYYSYYMARKMGFKKIAVATDPFQAKMLKGYPRRLKIKVDFIPFVIDSLRTMAKTDSLKINAEAARVPDFVSLEDRENRFKRAWGTLGKNVKRVEEDVRNKKRKKDKHQ